MKDPSSGRRAIVTAVGLVLFVRAVYYAWFTLPAFFAFLDIIDGRAPLTAAFPFRVAGNLLAAALPFYAWGLIRGRAASRIGVIGILGVQMLLAGMDVIKGRHALDTVLIGNLVISFLSIVILLIPNTKKSFREPTKKDWDVYYSRMHRFRRIKSGWRTVGNSGGVVIINIFPFNFLLLPFAYAAGWIYYLLVVPPCIPVTRKKTVLHKAPSFNIGKQTGTRWK